MQELVGDLSSKTFIKFSGFQLMPNWKVKQDRAAGSKKIQVININSF